MWNWREAAFTGLPKKMGRGGWTDATTTARSAIPPPKGNCLIIYKILVIKLIGCFMRKKRKN
jgi:hypothetical protein